MEHDPPAGAFDLAIVFYLHLPRRELEVVLRRAAGSVVPGGTFLLVGHDATNIARGYGGPQDPAVLYTAQDVTPHLPGLEIEHAGTVVRTVETDNGIHDAIDVLVRARRPA